MRPAINGERDVPEWLKFALLFGKDGDEGDGGTGDGGTGEGDEGEGDEGDESDEPDEESLEGLKKALAAERAQGKAAQKKLKMAERKIANAASNAAKKTGDDKSGKDESEDEGDKLPKAAQAKLDKLTVAYRTSTLKSLVSAKASDFQDPDDVYRFLNTEEFDYEQDDDDPSEVVWDEKEIDVALKALRKQRPYLLKPTTGSEGAGKTRTAKSGPKFAGTNAGRQTAGTDVAALSRRIPALRSVVRASSTKKE